MIAAFFLLLILLVSNLYINSVNLVFIIIMTLIFIYKFSKEIVKYEVLIYIVALILGILTYLNFNNEIFHYLKSGLVSFAFMIIVMYTGIISNIFNFKKKLLLNRKQLSIVAFILISAHAVYRTFAQVSLYGVIAYVLMIPLFITSFKVIRKEILSRDWQAIHKISYLAYVFLLLHTVIIADVSNKYIYIIIATIYIYQKTLNIIKESLNEINRKSIL